MFKLDLVACIDALDRCENENDDADGEGGGEPAGAVLDELSRQIKDAGGPDGGLETQLRELLAKDARIRELEAQIAARPIGIPDPPPPPPPPSVTIDHGGLLRLLEAHYPRTAAALREEMTGGTPCK